MNENASGHSTGVTYQLLLPTLIKDVFWILGGEEVNSELYPIAAIFFSIINPCNLPNGTHAGNVFSRLDRDTKKAP
jgi:hypothetical protein